MNAPKDLSPKDDSYPAKAVWPQLMGMGIEFAGVLAIFAYGGYKVDEQLGTEPWCLLGAFFFALIGMTYLIIKRALRNQWK